MNPRAMSLWISPAASCAGSAARNRPGAAFVFADREERNVPEQIVAGADDAIEARFLQPQVGEERRGVGGLELRDFELDLRADGDGRRAGAREKRRQPGRFGARRCRSLLRRRRADCFVEVDDDEQRLRRQELKAAQPLQIVALQVERAQRPPVFERRAAQRDDVAFALELGGLRLS